MKSFDELDHPCKETCSGWKQGFEKGQQQSEKELSYYKRLVPDKTIKSAMSLLIKNEQHENEIKNLKKIFEKLGPWASAAQGDPKCCQELKDIFLEVIEVAVNGK